MRDGDLLADDTPEGLLEKSGAEDVEQAFLTLIEKAGAR
jgi:ABC-2 type transport system ATP-binding protein